MRRFWILIVVVAMALAIAGPATGKKPEGKPNPNAAPIAAHVENGPWWVHEDGDVIVYSVYVENKTRSTPIAVTVSTDFVPEPLLPVVVDVEGGTTEVVVFERTVSKVDLISEEIVSTMTVAYQLDGMDEPVTIDLEAGTVVEAYDDCHPDIDSGTAVEQAAGVCIWHTEQRGAWTISVVPADLKVRNMTVTLRDHVPGNWCTPDGSGGGAYVRWQRKDATRDPLTLDVFLPNATDTPDGGDPLGDGVCYGGGAGGATMQDGYPDSFYLWLRHDADVTISRTTP